MPSRQTVAISWEEYYTHAVHSNLSHCNDILFAPAGSFLARQPYDNHETTTIQSSLDKTMQIMMCGEVNKGLSIRDVFDDSTEELITVPSRGKTYLLKSLTSTQPTDALTHLSFIQNYPGEVFLRPRKCRSTPGESDCCSWLHPGVATKPEKDCR